MVEALGSELRTATSRKATSQMEKKVWGKNWQMSIGEVKITESREESKNVVS
jgi:hypothetical protein